MPFDDPRTGQSPSPESTSLDSTIHEDSSESPFPEPYSIPIDGVLDLHTVAPRDAQAVVEEYLRECHRRKVTAIRVIHGKGIGVQREMVRNVLARLDFVQSYGDAPAEAGGWGATLVTLRSE